jgi:hypothetical protein
MLTTRIKAGSRLFHAQLLQPRHKPPLARVVSATYYGAGRLPGKIRIRVPHAPFPFDVDARWCTADPDEANALLAARVAHEIAEHEIAIRYLEHAQQESNKQALIAW